MVLVVDEGNTARVVNLKIYYDYTRLSNSASLRGFIAREFYRTYPSYHCVRLIEKCNKTVREKNDLGASNKKPVRPAGHSLYVSIINKNNN